MSERLSSDTFRDLIRANFGDAALRKEVPEGASGRYDEQIDPALRHTLDEDHVFQRSLGLLREALEGLDFELQESRRITLIRHLKDPYAYGLEAEVGARVVDYYEQEQDDET